MSSRSRSRPWFSSQAFVNEKFRAWFDLDRCRRWGDDTFEIHILPPLLPPPDQSEPEPQAMLFFETERKCPTCGKSIFYPMNFETELLDDDPFYSCDCSMVVNVLPSDHIIFIRYLDGTLKEFAPGEDVSI